MNELSDISILKHINNLNIVCLDSCEDTREMYDEVLEDSVNSMIFTSSVEEAYESYSKNRVDILLVSYTLDSSNGLEFCKLVRKRDRAIPIILVSDVEDISVVREALNSGINNCIKKPIVPHLLLESIINASRLIIADGYLKNLEDEKKYSSFQEDLAFQKQLNILRNDFYYQMLESQDRYLVDILYKPLDVLSGDAYSIRKITSTKSFYLIVDGMGKGVSASLSAMLLTSYVNNLIDEMCENFSFNLETLVVKAMSYIQPILLEEEALAIDFITIDFDLEELEYAKFAMPVSLLQTQSGEIIRVKSNNPPLCKYQPNAKVSCFNISDVVKYLFYSDGVVENETNIESKLYMDFIEEDFSNSITREGLKNMFFDKIEVQDDDITLIFINKLDCHTKLVSSKIFETSMEDVDSANHWYSDIWKSFDVSIKNSYNAELVFSELFMNAYEHGNLAIDSRTKHLLLENDIYFEELLKQEKECNKKIIVSVHKIKSAISNFIITQIVDEGEGFDTQKLSELFRNTQAFNGRGVVMSRKNSFGMYYNKRGTSVLWFNKI